MLTHMPGPSGLLGEAAGAVRGAWAEGRRAGGGGEWRLRGAGFLLTSSTKWRPQGPGPRQAEI